MAFVDEAVLQAIAGDGGNGCIAFRREKYVPRGGPSGGDGGMGGSVYLIGDDGLNTLSHIRFRSVIKAKRGRHGEGSNRTGRGGEDAEVRVPPGTLVYRRESDEYVGEVLGHGERLQVAKGGLGGRGNARFANATRKAPRYAEDGREGESLWLRLELKLLADVGLVGLPNAGKSTFISAVSSAKPKIADYPFTTLIPQLGVVAESYREDPFVIADLPGLIAGAAEGAGLGFQFLRHVERCRLLLHLVDLSALEEDTSAQDDFETIEGELVAFRQDLLQRPRLVVGSKLDAVDENRRKELQELAASRGLEYFEISSATHEGLKPLISRVRQILASLPAPQPFLAPNADGEGAAVSEDAAQEGPEPEDAAQEGPGTEELDSEVEAGGEDRGDGL